MDGLEEINYEDISIGERYLAIRNGREPKVITVQRIQDGLREHEGIGTWGFVISEDDSSYPAYEHAPPPGHELFRIFGVTRFYEVPDDEVLNNIITEWRQEHPGAFQPIQEFPNIGHNLPINNNNNNNNRNNAYNNSDSEDILYVDQAPHIGVLSLDLAAEFPEGNSFRWEPFVNGQDYVRLQKDDRFIFRQDDLQTLWNMGRGINPVTGLQINQEDVERFTYKNLRQEGGRKKRKNTKNTRKAKKSKKSKKTRKNRTT